MFGLPRQPFLKYAAALATALLDLAPASLPASANSLVRSAAPQAARAIPHSHPALVAGKTPLVYVSDYAGTVLGYDATLTGSPPPNFSDVPVETITGLHGPTSLAVDSIGNLYVVEATTNDVQIFAPGMLKPFKTLAGLAGTQASQIALDGNANVYVSTNLNKIAVYRNGATTPSATLTDRSIASITSIAADRVGNIFVTYVTQAAGVSAVGTFPARISEGTGFFAPLPELNGSGTPFQMAVDSAGDLVVGDAAQPPLLSGHDTLYRSANATPAGIYPFDNEEVRERVALTASANIFFAYSDRGFITMRSLPLGELEILFLLPRAFTTSSIATYPAAPLGTW